MLHSVKPIGGYFSLELPKSEEYHSGAIRLNSGKNCLEYILRARKYHKVYIPYYTCGIVVSPFEKLGITYEFYHIDSQFEIAEDILLRKGEALLYTNYFGLKQRYIEDLVEKYERNLIVDNTQAFYADHILEIDTFYTCRKFFGVPDGAYLYCDIELEEEIEQDHSFERMAHLLKRIDLSAEEGFADFKRTDHDLGQQPMRMMSNLTRRIMQSIDYDAAAKQRRANFLFLHEGLGKSNNIHLPLDYDTVPMVYPFWTSDKDLRKTLIDNKIFVARYWPNVLEWTKPNDVDYKLANRLLPLPIDQRYGEEEMNRILKVIQYGS